MWPEYAPEHVIGCTYVRDPIAHRFVDGVLQGFASGRNRQNTSTEKFHAEDVQFLATYIFFTHVNVALEGQQCTNRGRGDAMLPGTGFRDDAFFAHPPGEQSLSEAVVDFVRSGVVQIFAFEIN